MKKAEDEDTKIESKNEFDGDEDDGKRTDDGEDALVRDVRYKLESLDIHNIQVLTWQLYYTIFCSLVQAQPWHTLASGVILL